MQFLYLTTLLWSSISLVSAIPNPQITTAPAPKKPKPASQGCEAAGAAYGSDPIAKSSLTWDCANFLGSRLITSTILTTDIETIRGTTTHTITAPAKTTVTVSYSSRSTRTLTHVTGYIHTRYEYPWTVTVGSPSPKVIWAVSTRYATNTPTVTVVEGFVTVTPTGIPTYTEIGPPEFDYSNPVPAKVKGVGECSEKQFSAYCSGLLNAPIPTPFTTKYFPYTRTRRVYSYDATVTTTFTPADTTTWIPIPDIVTLPTTTLYPTTTIPTTTTVYSPTSAPPTTAYTIYTVTNTFTKTISTSGTITATAIFTTSTPIIPIPPVCRRPDFLAGTFFARYFSSTPWDGMDDYGSVRHKVENREQCCALCHTSTRGCAIYDFHAPIGACYLHLVSSAPEEKFGGPGYVTDTCPKGMLAGDWLEDGYEYDPIRHTYHAGNCWNGWRPEVGHVKEFAVGYNHCLEKEPVEGCY